MIKLSLPYIPPSQNQMYSSVRGRLIKSKAAREFDSDCDFWAKTMKRSLSQIKLNLEAIRANGGYFKVDTIFVFHKKKVFSQKGTLKKLDPSNRIKSLHDNLARILGIDDTYFVSGEFSKATCDRIEDERVLITITKGELLRFEDM